LIQHCHQNFRYRTHHQLWPACLGRAAPLLRSLLHEQHSQSL
jgi:hypothetical protein